MTVSYTPPFTFQNNTTADATQVNANFTAVQTSFGNAASSGVNSDITALTALSVPITPAQGGTSLYVGGTTTGSANAQTLSSVVPTGFTLIDGHQVLFLAGFANTGAATLNVAGTGAVAVKIQTPAGDQPLVGGEILSGQWNMAIYHASDSSFHLFGVSAQLGGIGNATIVPSQATTDLALAGNHWASITGGTTITSFGSNADVNFPFYLLLLAGVITLTNSTNLILPGGADITTAVGDSAGVTYLGSGRWRVIWYTKASGQAVVSGRPPPASFSNLSIKVATNTTVTCAADEVVMWDTSGNPITGALSATCDLGTNGAVNRLDAGTIAIDTWYAIWAISNGTTVGTLASTSFSAPTMPSGYIYKARIGAVQTIHASATLYGTWQFGKKAQYVMGLAQTTTAPNIANGIAGTLSGTSNVTYASVTVAGNGKFVPPTASEITILVTTSWHGSTASDVAIAPSTTWGGAGNSVGGANGVIPPAFINGANVQSSSLSFLLESTAIAWASNQAGAGISCLGWVDNL